MHRVAARIAVAPAGKTASRNKRRYLASEVAIPTERKQNRAGAPTFPCVDAHAKRERTWLSSSSIASSSSSSSSRTASSSNSTAATSVSASDTGPEPPYARPSPRSYQTFCSSEPLPLTYGSTLPSFDIAYETWGTLNTSKSNAILLHTGLSASSHAASTTSNPTPGWWENFIGPGKAIDTEKYFVICTNVLGGCYGSTGPSSADPETGKPYGTRFPVISIFDMVRAQFRLLNYLGIKKLYASVGSSMGGMQSLAAGYLEPNRVGRIVSISGTARSSPSAIALRFAQRSVLMADPNWNNGMYYDGIPPHTGMKLARQIATVTYRSGPEWDQRFGRRLRELPESQEQPNQIRVPSLCPDFLIETYLDHQGEQFCLKYDANSLIYISKAMDLFDMTASALRHLGLMLPEPPVESVHSPKSIVKLHPTPPHLTELASGLAPLANIPALVLGVQSDILFTVDQQREVADALRMAGNEQVSYYELGGVWGHDTFLLDVRNVGGALKGFLDSL